jgi:hypothetical protein
MKYKNMKYKLTIRQGFEVLLYGVLQTPPSEGRIVRPNQTADEEMDKAAFELEQAINANTSLRAHIERAE